MPKEKHLIEKKENDYFIDLICFFTIIIIIIILGCLGNLGFKLNLTFKIIFGEWYFVFLILLSFHCFMYLFKGHGYNFRSSNFSGLVFIYLGITTLSHFSVFNYLGSSSKTIFKDTISVYKDYFKSYENYYVGGGVIGLILFFVEIVSLSKVGVIIVSLFLIIVGISSFINHTLLYVIKKVFNFILLEAKLKGKIISFLRNLTEVKDDKKYIVKKPSLSMLNDVNVSSDKMLQQEINNNIKETVLRIINSNDIKANISNIYCGYQSSTIELLMLEEPNKKLNEIFKALDRPFFMQYKDKIWIDYKNQFKELLTLKKVLQDVDLKYIPIAVSNNGDVIGFDFDLYNTFLLIGEKGSGLKTFIRSFLVSLILVYKDNIVLNVFDLKKEMRQYFIYQRKIHYFNLVEDIQNNIEQLIFKYDRRMEIINYLNCQNYNEVNLKILNDNLNIKRIIPEFTILNLNFKGLKSASNEKIEFLINNGLKVGLYFVIMIRDDDSFDLINNQNIYKIIFKMSNLSMAIKLSFSDIPCILDRRGDIITIENKKIRHGQTPYTSISDFLNVVEKFTF